MKQGLKYNRIILSLMILTLSCLASTVSAGYDFNIQNFHSDLVINEDGSVIVNELLDVRFNQQKHGIYRDIPVKYVTDDGSKITTPLNVISVTDGSGRNITYTTFSQGNVIRIRIGDANRLISGDHTYQIKYEVKRVVLYFEDHDELYWNVTGNEWRVPIYNSSATITLNTDKTNKTNLYACYSGSYGSTESDCDYHPLQNGIGGSYVCTRKLSPSSGFTVVFGWDKGIVYQPTATELFWEKLNLANNWVYILPLLTFLYMFYTWNKSGKDPKPSHSMMVRYEPPVDNNRPLTPAEVGVLIDDAVNTQDFSSGMISLAVKGFITIEATEFKILFISKPDHTLTKIKEADDSLSEFEKQLLADLFEYGNTVTMLSLKNKFYKKLPILKKLIFQQLIDKKYYAASPASVRGKYAGFAIAIVALMFFFIKFVSNQPPFVTFFLAGLSGFIMFLFSFIMPRKTRTGVEMMTQCKGFREFLERAEKDKIERMQKEDNVFYKYLPYAIALDVVDQWADAFQGLDVPPPTWYVGAMHMPHFSTRVFSESLMNTTSQFGQTVYSAPRGSGTSGGGGGGFSGGGSGGGGGGSW